MGFFDLKAKCGVCGKEVGWYRFKIKKSDAWCCPDCFKKANRKGMVDVSTITIPELKKLVGPIPIVVDTPKGNSKENVSKNSVDNNKNVGKNSVNNNKNEDKSTKVFIITFIVGMVLNAVTDGDVILTFVGVFAALLFSYKAIYKQNDENRKSPIITMAVLSLVLVVFMGAVNSCTGGGGSDDGTCPVCHREFTDYENQKSIRWSNMCKSCKHDYDAVEDALGGDLGVYFDD